MVEAEKMPKKDINIITGVFLFGEPRDGSCVGAPQVHQSPYNLIIVCYS